MEYYTWKPEELCRSNGHKCVESLKGTHEHSFHAWQS
jgi:hypothetical protein